MRLNSLTIIVAGLLAFLFTGPLVYGQSPADIPVKAFAALPDFSRPKLSPSGHAVGYIGVEKGRRLLQIYPLDGGAIFEIPPQYKSEISSFSWINDETVLLTLRTTASRARFVGVVAQTRLVAYNLNERKARWLGEPENNIGLSSNGRQYASQFERVLSYLPEDPKNILISLDLGESSKGYAVYRVNIKTGRRKIVKYGAEGVQNWYADRQGEVRLGLGFRKNNKRHATLKDQAGKWRNLDRSDWYETYSVVAFTADPDVLFVRGPSKTGTEGLFKLSISKSAVTEEIFVRENADLGSVYFDKEGQLLGVSYRDDFQRFKYFNADYAALQKSLDGAFPGTNSRIIGHSASSGRFLILNSNDRNPGTYYLFDQQKGKISALANLRNAIDPALMAQTRSVSIPVRDGTHIPGYVTLPAGTSKAVGLPFIVLPHGGPASYDTAAWDFWTQFYASRGYGVLRPNFRGSTSYGDKFASAGYQQWGGLMQDDVTDATKWLIAEGMADAGRICIVGASYGGYAALMGIIKEPGLYKCAISVNGVMNLPSMKKYDTRFVGGKTLVAHMGLAGVSDKKVSPFHLAKRVKVPVLLIASKDDVNVPADQSKGMHKKLKSSGKISKLVILKGGDHSMITVAARLKMLRESEKFLKKHLG